MGLSTAMVRNAFLVNAAYSENSREYGFSPQQGQLLCILRSQPYGMGELGAVLGLAKSSVTGLVDRLERGGLVRREPDPADSRAVRVALTARGGKIADQFYTETRERILGLAAGLTDAERETLAALLARIADENNVSVIFMDLD
ncbi:MarR family transcriptional regulator [Paractinoplanes durhamensis]|uniref:MarR family transcriptional regulator n=2 Tax=Paractinoplanes durhamensis TaxID=113563 RepID=A0ABQ3YVU7_9ACTN|nr:MarR family transcriptional regulator [Actinoplanes durhamensis]